MSDAATPGMAPASGGTFDVAESLVEKLLGEDAAAEAASGTDAGPDDQQQTEAAQPSEPNAGDDNAQAKDPDPQEEEQPRYRVKVRGEEREVPLRELLDGYSRTEDYKAKTAEVAEQRRALEATQAEIQQRAQRLDQLLAQAPYDPIIDQGMKTDWVKLAQENPADFVAKRAEFEARNAFWQQVSSERERATIEAHQRRLAAAEAELSNALPEWRDGTKRPELQAKIRDTLTNYGFRQDELSGIADHRILQVALDAARYREMQAAQVSAQQKKATPAPTRVIRPGNGESSKAPSQTARDLAIKARRTGRVDDAVNAALAALET